MPKIPEILKDKPKKKKLPVNSKNTQYKISVCVPMFSDLKPETKNSLDELFACREFQFKLHKGKGESIVQDLNSLLEKALDSDFILIVKPDILFAFQNFMDLFKGITENETNGMIGSAVKSKINNSINAENYPSPLSEGNFTNIKWFDISFSIMRTMYLKNVSQPYFAMPKEVGTPIVMNENEYFCNRLFSDYTMYMNADIKVQFVVDDPSIKNVKLNNTQWGFVYKSLIEFPMAYKDSGPLLSSIKKQLGV